MATITLPRRTDVQPVDSLPPAPAAPCPGRARRFVRGPASDPVWARPALLALLAATAGLYLWGLGASGWANSFYSAAVQAGTKSWKAFFFGSSDAANAITVDKPPAALWVMEISARMFGVNSWSILVPQALEGVAAVGLLYAAVKRWFGAGAGLLAGAILALTPVSVLMFRFNNPDALLVLLLVGAAYAVTRALEAASTRWLLLASTLVGFGFLTKMLQTLLVLPAFGLVYLLAAPTTLRRRLLQLLAAAGALIVSSLWWVVAVMAVPAADRPYIGGSQNNSLWNLIFGYNGFGRLSGSESGSVGGGGGNAGRWGPTGWLRMFNSEFGAQASWLIPAALVLLAAGLLLSFRARRTDRTRAGLVLWGGWLVVTAATFSLSKGIIHPYYTVALAPAIGAVVGIGAAAVWARRRHWLARAALAASLGVTVLWARTLLRRTPNWHPWLATAIIVAGLGVAVLVLAWTHLHGRLAALVAVTAALIGLAAPGAYALATAASPHSGAIPSAGPSGAGGGFPGGGPGGGQAFGGPRTGGFPGGGQGGFPGAQSTQGGPGGGQGGFPAGRGPGGGNGGVGGLLNGSKPSTALTAALETDASRYTWVAATVGANSASGYQLATGKPVMAIGGFNGTDPSPTLAQFEALVRQHKIHWFIAGGGFGGRPGGASSTASTSSQITSWVESHATTTTVSGVTLYDLSSISS